MLREPESRMGDEYEWGGTWDTKLDSYIRTLVATGGFYTIYDGSRRDPHGRGPKTHNLMNHINNYLKDTALT